MGCEIHAYIEYDRSSREEVQCFAECILNRDYTLFALMAGVRFDPARMRGLAPVALPRGIPPHRSTIVDSTYFWEVDDEGAKHGWPRHCSRAKAEEYVRQGSHYEDERKESVSAPSLVSASWLTVDELEEVQRRYQFIESAEGHGSDDTSPDLLPLVAVIAAMKALDRGTPGRSRLVFWFDNYG